MTLTISPPGWCGRAHYGAPLGRAEVASRFRDRYTAEVTSGLQHSFSASDLDKAAQYVASALSHRKSTVYVFGNGGNYTIARFLEYCLKQEVASAGRTIRVHCGVDYHAAVHNASKGKRDDWFQSILSFEGADSEDLVIMLSASGMSENLLRASAYCRSANIPTLSFSAGRSSRLARPGVTSKAFCLASGDQQHAEDIFQLLVPVLAQRLRKILQPREPHDVSIQQDLQAYARRIASAMACVSGDFLAHLSESVANAILHGKSVFVMAPEATPLTLPAEHTAHNLHWDSVYHIPNPPPRYIHSSPTCADLSGVTNDRRMRAIIECARLRRVKRGDVVLLYLHEPSSTEASNVIGQLGSQGEELGRFAVAGGEGGDAAGRFSGICSLPHLNIADLTSIAQVIGHMIGRLVHWRLVEALEHKTFSPDEAVDFLASEDLAQRRLKNVVHGL